jgi:hypothetical protein
MTIARATSGSETSQNAFHISAARIFAALGTAVGLSLIAGPAGALAQTPTDDQYDPTIERISEGGGTATPDQVGGLPFTGFDVVGLIVVAACLTAAGVFLYRRSRHQGGGDVTP